MIRKKRLLLILSLLLLGSYLCFYPATKENGFEDWMLFLIVFSLTFLGVFLFFQTTWPHFRPKSSKKKTKYKAIFDALEEGFLLVDAKGEILEVNRQACQLLKSSKTKLIGQHLSYLVDSPLIEKCGYLFEQCRKAGLEQNASVSFEERCSSSFDLTVKELPEIGRFLVLIHDTSKQYQMHQLGKDFVANASHELRTPITIIKGFAETLRDLPEVSEDMFLDFTEKMIRNCQRMDQLVKNLLTLTDLDYLPKLRLQECDLVALVDNSIHTLLAVHPECHVEVLRNQEVILVPADPDLLELAIMNVLENSVKYSPSPAHLTLTIEDKEEEVHFTIADQGVGIAEADQKRIFDRFYTVDKAHSRRLGGAGLGLSIVQTIAKKHGAKLTILSAPQKGTEMIFIFENKAQKQNHFFYLESSKT